MLIRICFFLIMVLATSPMSAAEKAAHNLLDPNISYVVSGYSEVSGQFRVVVTDVGWEHVSSRIRLEWLSEGENQTWVVQKTVPIVEFEGGMLSVGMPVWVSDKSQIAITAKHTFSLEEYKFTLTPLAAGKYELKTK